MSQMYLYTSIIAEERDDAIQIFFPATMEQKPKTGVITKDGEEHWNILHSCASKTFLKNSVQTGEGNYALRDVIPKMFVLWKNVYSFFAS